MTTNEVAKWKKVKLAYDYWLKEKEWENEEKDTNSENKSEKEEEQEKEEEEEQDFNKFLPRKLKMSGFEESAPYNVYDKGIYFNFLDALFPFDLQKKKVN